jgi:hypothetical protein
MVTIEAKGYSLSGIPCQGISDTRKDPEHLILERGARAAERFPT